MNLFQKLAFLLLAVPAFSQSNNEALKIFLNCNNCDQEYVKQNLDLVEFVRDRQFADVDLLFRDQRNGSGGRTYEIEFIGKGEFEEIHNFSTFSTNPDNTRDDIRSMRLKHIKMGLVPFWMKNGDEDDLSIKIKKRDRSQIAQEEKDPWNYWVFRVGVDGSFDGQEVRESRRLFFNASAKRVTEKNKFSFNAWFNDRKSTYSYDGEDIVSVITSKNFYLSDVVSINDHWSFGAFVWAGEDTYRNYQFYVDMKPAIEYNFFNYEDSAEKQLTIGYRIGSRLNNYNEKTIFGEEDEWLWEHELSLEGNIIEEWGSVSGGVSYESFLHDVELDAFSFFLRSRVRIIKGLSFNVRASYEIQNNQINIAAGDISLEDLLLSQQQVSSGYSYNISTGLSYSFGSLYNTIVNPRFNF